VPVSLLLVFVTLATDVMTLDHRCNQHQICYEPHLRFLHILLYVSFPLLKALPPRTVSDHELCTLWSEDLPHLHGIASLKRNYTSLHALPYLIVNIHCYDLYSDLWQMILFRLILPPPPPISRPTHDNCYTPFITLSYSMTRHKAIWILPTPTII
jgi:hypothetical protein